MKPMIKTCLAGLIFTTASAGAFELTSTDISEGAPMAKTFEFSGWGCKGDNLSPQLAWTHPPKGTQSYALTVYDPDAPTGSGFWHWVTTDIPASVTALARGADIKKSGGHVFTNDYGNKAFGGACPPVGDGMHRYQFTVWALPVKNMELPPNASPAVVGFYLNSMALDKARLTTTYHR